MGFEFTERRVNGGLGEIHCCHEERLQRERNIGCCFSAKREAMNVRNRNWNESYEIGVEIERLKLELCIGWQNEGDFVSSFC